MIIWWCGSDLSHIKMCVLLSPVQTHNVFEVVCCRPTTTAIGRKTSVTGAAKIAPFHSQPDIWGNIKRATSENGNEIAMIKRKPTIAAIAVAKILTRKR
jgi:hypothetical protein